MKLSRIAAGLVAGSTLLAPAGLASAQDQAANRPGPTWVEFQKLQQEVHEQRNLLIQLMQTEQQRYDMLLKLVQGGPAPAAAPVIAPPGPGALLDDKKGKVMTAMSPRPPGAELAARTGFVEGKVLVPGGNNSDLYVYVENVRGPRVNRHVEIKQENKQFIPRLQVVQVGTTVTFPNLDPIFHNVFSNSPSNTFDLGSYRAGDTHRSVVMTKPGVVDIYCNMHQRMSANVLVVPSKHYTKVRPDGSFRLEDVPVGSRTLVAWSPSLKPMEQKVEVTASGARTTFQLEYTDRKTHTNKFGQPYGSYKE